MLNRALRKTLNCRMDFKFQVNDQRLEDAIFESVKTHVIEKHISRLLDKHDSELKKIIIGTCKSEVEAIFHDSNFKEWIEKAIKIEVSKIKKAIEHSESEYGIAINAAIKDEVKRKVKSVTNEPGFDHYIMGCVQLEVKDKLLTFERNEDIN